MENTPPPMHDEELEGIIEAIEEADRRETLREIASEAGV